MLRRFQPSALPEAERLAFLGALAAMAACDGAPSLDETLAVLGRVDLDDLPHAVGAACDRVIDPPPLTGALASLGALGDRERTAVFVDLLLVAHADGDLVPAELEALAHARAALGLTEGQVRAAERRASAARRDRERGPDADWLDSARNLLVLLAGFGVPVCAVVVAGGPPPGAPLLALPLGIEALGLGYGPVAGVGAAMGLSVAASAGVSFATQRGLRAERFHRELLVRNRRERANLGALVATLQERVDEATFGGGPRVGLVALEERMQLYRRALERLPDLG